MRTAALCVAHSKAERHYSLLDCVGQLQSRKQLPAFEMLAALQQVHVPHLILMHFTLILSIFTHELTNFGHCLHKRTEES